MLPRLRLSLPGGVSVFVSTALGNAPPNDGL